MRSHFPAIPIYVTKNCRRSDYLRHFRQRFSVFFGDSTRAFRSADPVTASSNRKLSSAWVVSLRLRRFSLAGCVAFPLSFTNRTLYRGKQTAGPHGSFALFCSGSKNAPLFSRERARKSPAHRFAPSCNEWTARLRGRNSVCVPICPLSS